MRYLVVIEKMSAIGCIYDKGNNDGYVTDGEFYHPVINCSEISINSPYYLYVKRDLTEQDKNHQSLYIPHTSIVAIYEYDGKGSRPVGFVLQRKNEA
jgi:hypothetical protein